MSGFIELDGFDDLETLLQDMTITEADEKKAMKKALKPIVDEIEKNTPERSKKLKKSIKRIVKREGLAIVGIVRLGKFYDVFQEFGTSQTKANVGFFEKSVNRSENEAIEVLRQELLK